MGRNLPLAVFSLEPRAVRQRVLRPFRLNSAFLSRGRDIDEAESHVTGLPVGCSGGSRNSSRTSFPNVVSDSGWCFFNSIRFLIRRRSSKRLSVPHPGLHTREAFQSRPYQLGDLTTVSCNSPQATLGLQTLGCFVSPTKSKSGSS